MERPILNPMLALIEEPERRSRGPQPDASGGYSRSYGSFRTRLPRGAVVCPLPLQQAACTVGPGLPQRGRLGCRTLLQGLGVSPALPAAAGRDHGVGVVFSGTHPKPKPVELDPSSSGLYYDPVAFASADGTQLEAWIVPVLSAKEVLAKREKMLRAKHPAVLLVHDFGKTQQQMLPLLAPLQEDGIVTMTLGLRGSYAGQRVGQTFGLRESDDVSAAVTLLRNRPFVDPERIAILGIGSGATAAVRPAAKDPSIQLLVLLSPPTDARDVLARRVGPQRVGLQWMQPFCKWAFELGYNVDAEEISLDRYARVMENRTALLLDKDADLGRAREVLRLGLVERNKEAAQTAATN